MKASTTFGGFVLHTTARPKRLHGARFALVLCLAAASVAVAGCAGSSEPSGTYSADMGGERVTIVFLGGDRATVTLGPPGGSESLTNQCTVTKNGDEYLFVPDAGSTMTLTREGDTFKDDLGTVFRRE
jgi:hypothetical protein